MKFPWPDVKCQLTSYCTQMNNNYNSWYPLPPNSLFEKSNYIEKYIWLSCLSICSNVWFCHLCIFHRYLHLLIHLRYSVFCIPESRSFHHLLVFPISTTGYWFPHHFPYYTFSAVYLKMFTWCLCLNYSNSIRKMAVSTIILWWYFPRAFPTFHCS